MFFKILKRFRENWAQNRPGDVFLITVLYLFDQTFLQCFLEQGVKWNDVVEVFKFEPQENVVANSILGGKYPAAQRESWSQILSLLCWMKNYL